MFYRVQLELATLVVISSDCTGSVNSATMRSWPRLSLEKRSISSQFVTM